MTFGQYCVITHCDIIAVLHIPVYKKSIPWLIDIPHKDKHVINIDYFTVQGILVHKQHKTRCVHAYKRD